jgi:hypothetical protein
LFCVFVSETCLGPRYHFSSNGIGHKSHCFF